MKESEPTKKSESQTTKGDTPSSETEVETPEHPISEEEPIADPDLDTDTEPDTEPDTDLDCDEHDHDGHRPCRLDLLETLSRRSTVGTFAGQYVDAARTTSAAIRPPTASLRSRTGVQRRARASSVPESDAGELVDFEGPNDPLRPLNWPLRKKITTTLVYGLVTMSATWASSAFSAGTTLFAEEFHIGEEVANLGTSLFLFGFGIGPLLWAPLSEVYGRRAAVLPPMVVAACLSFASATARSVAGFMLTRFWCAFFASAPVTNTGGVLGDLFSPAARGVAMAGYAMAVVGGPTLGPIVSAAIASRPDLGWRWIEYLTGILQTAIIIVAALVIDECYPPSILVRKARRIRLETGDWSRHAAFEEWDVSAIELARKFLVRPIQLLLTPICFLMALYASFCYGILYMQLGGVPIIFAEVRGWSPFHATLPFLSILVGACLGAALNVLNQTYYNQAYHANGNRAVPEKRLPPMMLGSLLFASGQFLMGWTADPKYHWIAPCIGLAMLGTGFFTIFQAALNYLVDTFRHYAASAVAANTFLRSCFAGAFPLVVAPMYGNLGVGPASSITAGFATLLIPVPFVFYVFGKRIRMSSKWSREV